MQTGSGVVFDMTFVTFFWEERLGLRFDKVQGFVPIESFSSGKNANLLGMQTS
jgi:hypothetical protein